MTNNQTELNIGSHCIVIGDCAGKDLKGEDYQFIFKVGDKEYQTTMTPEEYEVINKVVRRTFISQSNLKEKILEQINKDGGFLYDWQIDNLIKII